MLPLRRLDDAKGRLGGLLAQGERAELALALLDRAVAAMLAGGVERLLVVTSDERLLGGALRLDPRALVRAQDPALPGLNGAVRQGQRWAAPLADGLLVILPDLPLLTADDVRAMCDLAREVEAGVLAPDRAGTGSNGLLFVPPHAVAPAYGPGSAGRHRAAFAWAGLPLVTLERPGVALDLDTAADLDALTLLGHDWRDLLPQRAAS